MENALGKPSPAYLRELREVAKAANALSSHLETANILPRDFPIEPVSTLCAALTLLPHGTSDGSVPVLIHARERVPALRREYVLSEPEEGEEREHHEIPPVFRGEELDRRLNELYAAVGTALDHYKAETRTEIEPDAERDAPVPALPEFSLDETVRDILRAEMDVAAFKKKVAEDSAARRGIVAADSQLKAGRSEATMPAPKPALLGRIGKVLQKTPEALETAGYWMSAVKDISDPLVDAGFAILRDTWTGILSQISSVGAALEETGRRMKKWRDGAPSNIGVPPADFDISEVHAMILRGEAPKASWRPFITALDFDGEREFDNLLPLTDLKALTALSLNNTQVRDLSPIAHLTALTHLYLAKTQVRDLAPVASLTALTHLYFNSTRVEDLAPLADITTMTHLHLNRTQVSDLSAIAGLTALTQLHLNKTQVRDLLPVAGLGALIGLFFNNTQVSNLSPITGLRSLSVLALAGTGVGDLSPVSGLKTLRRLDLRETQVRDLSPLSGLGALDRLYLGKNQDLDLSVLSHLNHLIILGGPAQRKGKPRPSV